MWTLCQISDFDALFESLVLQFPILRARQILGGEQLGYFKTF